MNTDLLCDKSESFASTTSSGCSAHPVDVVLCVCRDIIVDDHIHMWDIQPSVILKKHEGHYFNNSSELPILSFIIFVGL